MALPAGTWQNSDGLLVKFHGQYDIANPSYINRLRTVNSEGPLKYAIMDIDLEGAAGTYFPFDLTNDGTVDGFSDEENFIPAGASILRVLARTTEIAAGGTSWALGSYTVAGATTDDDGLITDANAPIANMDHLGDIIIGTGAQVADGAGEPNATIGNMYLAVKTTGTFTAGKAQVLIEYMA